MFSVAVFYNFTQLGSNNNFLPFHSLWFHNSTTGQVVLGLWETVLHISDKGVYNKPHFSLLFSWAQKAKNYYAKVDILKN